MLCRVKLITLRRYEDQTPFTNRILFPKLRNARFASLNPAAETGQYPIHRQTSYAVFITVMRLSLFRFGRHYRHNKT